MKKVVSFYKKNNDEIIAICIVLTSFVGLNILANFLISYFH